MKNNIKICHVCEKPADECTCCAECGHICSLDLGEPYCPVCFPEKQVDNK